MGVWKGYPGATHMSGATQEALELATSMVDPDDEVLLSVPHKVSTNHVTRRDLLLEHETVLRKSSRLSVVRAPRRLAEVVLDTIVLGPGTNDDVVLVETMLGLWDDPHLQEQGLYGLIQAYKIAAALQQS